MLDIITDNIDIWTSAKTPKANGGRGRSKNGEQTQYGIKKLRELILELAVRGKLVPQDPKDESASVLLERIAKEKAKLIKAGKVKKQKPLPEIMEDEKLFELPPKWGWVRFGEIAQHNSGKTLDRGRNTGKPRPYITTSNLYWGYFDLSNIRQMPIKEEEVEKCTARKGDLLICEGGEAGRAAVWASSKEICFQNHVHRARFYCKVDPYYVYRFLEKLNATGEIEKYRKGVGISNMSSKALSSIILPIPPLTEQHRIVTKVGELMALCDQLEKQQTDSNAAHKTLVETLLGSLTNSSNTNDFQQTWKLIENNFDTLFTTEHSIDQLKQTILQLAVMGKLVPQDPDDEPASILLKKIAKEKANLIKEGKIKKTKPLPVVSDEEKGFDIPSNWIWTRFDNLSLHSEAGWSPNCEPTQRNGNNWGILKVSAVTWGKYDPKENKALPDNLKPKPEYEVKPGDFLISRANTADLVAKAVVVPSEAPPHLMMSDKIIRFVFSTELNHSYLKLVNESNFSRRYYARVAGGTSSSMKNVSREQIRNLAVPLPPLAEQNRIIAKVNKFMAICDSLRGRLTKTQLTLTYLADAIVEQAIA